VIRWSLFLHEDSAGVDTPNGSKCDLQARSNAIEFSRFLS